MEKPAQEIRDSLLLLLPDVESKAFLSIGYWRGKRDNSLNHRTD